MSKRKAINAPDYTPTKHGRAAAKELKAGDVVAYTARYLKASGADYGTAQRRGVFVAHKSEIGDGEFCYVHWNDEEAFLKEYAIDPEYCADVRARGSLCRSTNICKVGGALFSDTYA